MLALSGAGAAFAQGVEPLKVLEKERRDRLETDQRIAREAQARRLKEHADQAATAEARRKLDKEAAAPGIMPPARPKRKQRFDRCTDRHPWRRSSRSRSAIEPARGQNRYGSSAFTPTRVLIAIDKAAQRMLVTVVWQAALFLAGLHWARAV
jgi:hypothetical protein